MSVFVDRVGIMEHAPLELVQYLQYGEGAFETIRVDAKHGIEWCDAHWARWVEGLQYLGFDVESHMRMEDWVHAIEALAMTQGFSSDWMVARPQGVITPEGSFRWWMQWSEGKPWPQSIHMGRVPIVPLPDEFKPAALKLNLMSHYRQAERLAMSNGWDYPILCTKEGSISESSRANLFWFKGDQIFTPSKVCLPLHGVVRAALIEWAQTQEDLHVEEVEATIQDLLDSDGVVLSNSLQHLVWVERVENHSFKEPTQFEGLKQRFYREIPYTVIASE